MISENYTKNEIRQFKEFNKTGLRSVECPRCSIVARTEIDNEYIYCENCEDQVKVGRMI